MKDFDLFGTTGLTNAAMPAPGATVAEMLAIMNAMKEKMEAVDRECLRNLSEWCEATTCHVCGRKPTITKRRLGAQSIVACEHLVSAIKSKFRAVPSPVPQAPFGVPLGGIWLDVFDDGPRRF